MSVLYQGIVFHSQEGWNLVIVYSLSTLNSPNMYHLGRKKIIITVLFHKSESNVLNVIWIFTKTHSEHINLFLLSSSGNIFILVAVNNFWFALV